jgi:hypothetical protein
MSFFAGEKNESIPDVSMNFFDDSEQITSRLYATLDSSQNNLPGGP